MANFIATNQLSTYTINFFSINLFTSGIYVAGDNSFIDDGINFASNATGATAIVSATVFGREAGIDTHNSNTVQINADGSVTGRVGIRAKGESNDIIVAGSVYGTDFGIVLGTNDRLTVTGTVKGDINGVIVEGGNENSFNTINIAQGGVIEGGDLQIFFDTANPQGQFTRQAAIQIRVEPGQVNFINNAGMIIAKPDSEGLGYAVLDAIPISNSTNGFDDTNSGDTTLINSGHIEGQVVLGSGVDVIENSGTMNGQIELGAGGDVYRGYDGILTQGSRVFLGSDNDGFYGGSAREEAIGQEGDDLMRGGGSNDILAGEGDNDRLFGDEGDDLLNGGDGNDQLFGWTGNDTLLGGAGNDDLFGQQGNDRIEGGEGDDLARGGAGNDTIFGWVGNDLLFGDDGDDTMNGQGDNDELFGWIGNDNLSGDDGNDKLFGQMGDDVMSGGEGDDLLLGGLGNDTMVGNGGADRFEFFADDFTPGSRDVIVDYDAVDTYAFKGHPNLVSVNVTALGPDARMTVTLGDGSASIIDVFGATVADVNANIVFF